MTIGKMIQPLRYTRPLPKSLHAQTLFVLLMTLCLASPVSGQSFRGLGTPPAPYNTSGADGISADGTVILGYVSLPSSGDGQPCRWTNGSFMLLDDLEVDTHYLAGARAISADGTTIVGSSKLKIAGSYKDRAVVWKGTSPVQLELLGEKRSSSASGVSADGSTIVGRHFNDGPFEACAWKGGVIMLGMLPGGSSSYANGVSADGSVIVGSGGYSNGGGQEAFRWEGGMIGLGDLEGGDFNSGANAVSADGKIVVGYGTVAAGRRAVRWVNGKIESLGVTGEALAVSADGSVIVGSGGFIWTANKGFRSIKTVLELKGIDLGGWLIGDATGISADGTTIVGNGRNPAGKLEGYIAVIPPDDELAYTVGLQPSSVAIDDTVVVTIKVTNRYKTALTNIRPSGEVTMSSADGGKATLLSGPDKTQISQLEPNKSDSFVYRFKALANGHVDFSLAIEAKEPDGDKVVGIDKCVAPCGVLTISNGELIVNSTDDDTDEDPGDGECSTGQLVEIDGKMVPECTLRAAIEESNKIEGRQTISFDIPGAGVHTIRPNGSAFPPLEDPVSIDATTQPGYTDAPLIFIDGSLAGLSATGFRIIGGSSGGEPVGGESSIKGFAIGNFGGYGIHLRQGSNNVVESNYIGLNATGSTAAPNKMDGLLIESSPFNLISKNVISGNDSAGVRLSGGGETRLIGNRIGTNATANAALPNHGDGILADLPVIDHVVGGLVAGEGNIISGNGLAAISCEGSMEVLGNFVGVNGEGTMAIPNGKGIDVIRGRPIRIEGNVISANDSFGVRLYGDDRDRVNAEIISNMIGTDREGSSALGNQGPGILVTGDIEECVIGDPTQRNVISGNLGGGILLQPKNPYWKVNARTRIAGNLIGTDITGKNRIPNQVAGVQLDYRALKVDDISADTVGFSPDRTEDRSLEVAPRSSPINVISGNVGPGVWIRGYCSVLTGCLVNNAVVEGNFIGTDITGTEALGNTEQGIRVEDAPNAQTSRNLVSGNGEGMAFLGDFAPYRPVEVEANFIGCDINRSKALPNLGDGIKFMFNISPGNCGHSLVKLWGNTIVGNTGNGISISGSAPFFDLCLTPENVSIAGNAIGVIPAPKGGTPLAMGNGKAGILFNEDSRYNLVLGNNIAYNAAEGILIKGGVGQKLEYNHIFANGKLPVDLAGDGVTENDRLDEDDGPNDLTNHPEFEKAQLANGEIYIKGSMAGLSFTTYRVQFLVDAANVFNYPISQGFISMTRIRTPFTLDAHDMTGQYIKRFQTRFAAKAIFPKNRDQLMYGGQRNYHPIPVGSKLSGIASYSPVAEGQWPPNSSEQTFLYVEIEEAPSITVPSVPGDNKVELSTTAGFDIDDEVTLCPGCPNEEDATISGFGSLIFKQPLQFAHEVGEQVVFAARATDTLHFHSDTVESFFGGTGVSLRLRGTSDSGMVAVDRFRRSPKDLGGVSDSSILPHRWVVSIDGPLSFGKSSEIGFELGAIPNLSHDPSNRIPERINIYWRSTPGSGAFEILDTRYDDSAGSVIGEGLTAGGEFILVMDRVLGVNSHPPVAQSLTLSAAVPNPFTSSTSFTLTMPEAGHVTVAVFNSLGQHVMQLHDGRMARGTHLMQFYAENLPSGVYFIHASTPQGSQSRQVVYRP